ncbi:NAD-dependent epimerase/dehydratase family protein [Burkholderia stagnalis]|uniref:NAD-dependent epimerase n=1 Tax=Burkholderia stagnalis TaxID=1503054 RepID=A0A104K511_9BURK|nr:NAD-dependent epimerase/dehydratase family protein [Burkholderia stagnalis]AOK54522.1 NAD-dependent epimerase [Burkholderia stagnalis]KAB0631865.1 NAD-dependent epimerase/dehydratase family protein [Burkholderia stagnalis]KVC53317.1 NAD-dependent epimerase [Burkholderia stagnalis]KVM75782.1 NAD-dependent epimerase [Burkholderia stagnalis]KVM99341.1 NAD-dependent epimerase [Burkholderia stagnalis]
MSTLLVTGSAGLIGSEVVETLAPGFERAIGIDNNLRASFFGDAGDTTRRRAHLERAVPNYVHYALDVRDRAGVLKLLADNPPDLVVHAAAQPSHDLAARMPFDDFDVNAGGTLNLLEATRRANPEAVFVHLSTNKVYGDGPNRLKLAETDTRWVYADPADALGIGEDFPIDQSCHSVFGASKVAADVMVQEYGRYFGLRTCCLRGGCLTGPNQSGVQLHGFLNHLTRTVVLGNEYRIFGYRGKQVRDNIHSRDVCGFIRAFYDAPRVAEVYNLGGGADNSISVIEALDAVGRASGRKPVTAYVDEARIGDHICYVSDLTKIRSHYPDWRITTPLDALIDEMVERLLVAEGIGRPSYHGA